MAMTQLCSGSTTWWNTCSGLQRGLRTPLKIRSALPRLNRDLSPPHQNCNWSCHVQAGEDFNTSTHPVDCVEENLGTSTPAVERVEEKLDTSTHSVEPVEQMFCMWSLGCHHCKASFRARTGKPSAPLRLRVCPGRTIAGRVWHEVSCWYIQQSNMMARNSSTLQHVLSSLSKKSSTLQHILSRLSKKTSTLQHILSRLSKGCWGCRNPPSA